MTMLDMAITRAPGFTLIELVAVIAVLAILSAVALPRFLDIARDARVAKLNGALASMRSGAELARMRQELDLNGPNASIIVSGVTVAMQNGYPRGAADGIVLAAGLNVPADYEISTAFLPANTIHVFVTGGSDQSNCRIRYRGPTAVGLAPTLTQVTTGC